jgi:hypothetical protein
MPRDPDASSVRASTRHRAGWWAQLVHSFCPVITQSSPSGTALVLRDPRSLPASASENPWHHSSSPRSMRGTTTEEIARICPFGPSTIFLPAKTTSWWLCTRRHSQRGCAASGKRCDAVDDPVLKIKAYIEGIYQLTAKPGPTSRALTTFRNRLAETRADDPDSDIVLPDVCRTW